jgi:hypothetical protein
MPHQCVLAQCYAAVGHRELAGQMYRFVFSLPSLPDRLLPVVAEGLGQVGEFTLALEACRRAAACELDNGQPWYGMAHYMDWLGYPLGMIVSVSIVGLFLTVGTEDTLRVCSMEGVYPGHPSLARSGY